MRVLLTVLVLVGVFVQAMSQGRAGYADSWAVEVSGGAAAAEELAAKHGFIFRGQVGNLKNMYHFELPNNGGERSQHKTDALKAEAEVGYVEQQAYRQMSKKKPFK